MENTSKKSSSQYCRPNLIYTEAEKLRLKNKAYDFAL